MAQPLMRCSTSPLGECCLSHSHGFHTTTAAATTASHTYRTTAPPIIPPHPTNNHPPSHSLLYQYWYDGPVLRW